jgi:hypothetical protein
VKANEIHKDNGFIIVKLYWKSMQEGEIYFEVRMNQKPQPWNTISTVSNGMSIFTDNLKIAKHMILTMTKETY